MRSYYTEYTNHMLRVYYAKAVNLSDVEQLNVAIVKDVLENGKCPVEGELLKECLSYIYNPPCEDFGGRVEQFAALKDIKVRDVYAILARVSKVLATERGLI